MSGAIILINTCPGYPWPNYLLPGALGQMWSPGTHTNIQTAYSLLELSQRKARGTTKSPKCHDRIKMTQLLCLGHKNNPNQPEKAFCAHNFFGFYRPISP
jgi:hypothetical protein